MSSGARMSPDRWQRIKQILEVSLEMPAADRSGYIKRVCQNEPELLAEVQSLIQSYEEAGDLLDTPALETNESAVALADRLDESIVGRRIGPYRITAEIARGGMGTVYRAERADGHFNSQVAIKVIKRGLGDEFIIRRFRHERQIMASLEHPNIARLMDGGSTEDGLPYFVMEYIEGMPIDRYCDENRLSIRERLELFRTVCSAVQYAHDQLVVHRDIKPGNIMITAGGVPKLLDFGISKLLNPDFAMTGSGTVTAVRLMTPEYASPEQILGEPVTVGSDIYSLGVLLYELLTGRRPYRLKNPAPHELARQICDVDPDRPSTVVRRQDSGTAPEELSRARRTQPERLRRLLAGDLDNIVMTAMRKEPRRRYLSVEQFAEDIRRYLEGFPVTARKDTFLYRFSKFVERKKTALAFSLAGAIVVAGIFTLTQDRGFDARQPLRISPLTTYPGDETQPAFAPDGKRVAFVWNTEGDNQDIYVRDLDTRELLRITTDPAQDNSPTWSPDGRSLAFLRASRSEVAIFVSPLGGGAHRKVADVYPSRVEAAGIEAVGRPLEWSPDGRYLAIGDRLAPEEPFSIFLVDVLSGARSRVTFPPAKTIGDSNPSFSRDGTQLSFIRATSSGVADLYVQPLAGGGARRLTSDNRDLLSHTWVPDGSALVFSSNRNGNYNLWRLPPSGGTPERLPGIGLGASDPYFSRDSRRMVYSQFFLDTNIWSLNLEGDPHPQRVIVSTQFDSSPTFSPDGRRIAFRSSRGGSHEIWIANRDGMGAEQLTQFGGPLTGTPKWSPDGNWIAFDSRPEGQADIYAISPNGGTPRRITTETSEDVVPSWSRDGRWIYFASNRTGAWQVWRVPFEGGRPEQVTHLGGFAACESPDGRYVYYAKARSLPGLWRVAVGTRREELVTEQLKAGFWGYWALTPEGVYFMDQQPEGTNRAIRHFDFATRKTRVVLPIDLRPIIADYAFTISPDFKTILYTLIDQSGSDIMLAEYRR